MNKLKAKVKYTLFIWAMISFSLISVQAQDLKVNAQDTTDYQRIRKELPGKNMGEKLESLLFWSQAEKQKRFPVMHKIFPSHKVETGQHTYALKTEEALMPIWEDKTTLDFYMKTYHIGGVMVLENGKIRLERYGENVTAKTLWTSFSVAKSVTSMLLGAALKDGYISDLDDDLQTYIPELKGYDYGKVSIRQLMTMTSGINWNEDYEDPQSDVAQMYLSTCQGKESHILTYMKPLKFKDSGEHLWNYSTGEIDLAGILVQKATGKTLAEYLSEKIWKPMGMQEEAFWLSDECSDLNIGGSGLSASLRDYARLGQLMLNNGKINRQEIFAEEWLTNATSVLYEIDEQGNGYGYLWWCFKDGSYAAIGIFGQMIYVNPKENLVIAQVAAWSKASSPDLSETRMQFIRAVRRGLK